MWSDLKMIYSKLQDEESRFIFMKRLQYSLCNQDMESVYEMVVRKEDDGQHSLYTLLKERDHYSIEQPVIIFGAGFGGKVYKPFIEGYKVGRLVAFCDNNRDLQGTICEGLPVLSVEEANRQEPTALYILSNTRFSEEMKRQLLGLGVGQERIFNSVSYEPIYGSQYFERDIIRRNTGGEVFFDGGSFDLTDTIHFIDEYPKFKKVYAFEPDPVNYMKCQENKKRYLNNDDRIEIINKGLWSEEGALSFMGGISTSSRLSEYGEEIVNVTSIDAIKKGGGGGKRRGSYIH